MKTELVTFCKINEKRACEIDYIRIGNTLVSKVSECNYLGIKLDKKLTLQNQAKTILKTMAKATRAIDSIKKQLQTETLKILLQTLVFFHVDYSSLFRQHMSNASLLFLEKQTNWALK